MIYQNTDGGIKPEVKEVTYHPSLCEITEPTASEIGRFIISYKTIMICLFSVAFGKTAPSDLELNTPLVQDEFQDPLKQFLKN